MAQPFLGEIEAFPYNFAPRGWAFCAGQLLQIQQNTALFALLGTTFGGDGVRTFALPDLRGRIAEAAFAAVQRDYTMNAYCRRVQQLFELPPEA